MSGLQYKLEGNRMFSQRKYDEAIKLYTKAINSNSNNAVFYTNRAVCNVKLQRWDDVIEDCKMALDHDSQSVKAYFFAGQAHLELENHDESVCHLEKAHGLARQQKLNFGDDIAALLRSAKKKRWDKFENERIKQEIELQSYLEGLIQKDKAMKMAELEDEEGGSSEKEKLKLKFDERSRELNSLFSQIDERRQKREVPDHLCGKISFEIMKDPVITPSGITYDRKDIEEHLQRVGHFDPVTRQKLKASDLIPNLALNEVITKFVEENGWVEEY